MAAQSKIEWTDATWNPVMGCTPASEGCAHCYARAMMKRYAGRNGWPESPGTVTLFPERLEQPLHWRKPRRVFVCSMSDLFHEDVPFWFVADVFDVMGRAAEHTFQVLTKRPQRMLEFYDYVRENRLAFWHRLGAQSFPLGNVWIGVTAENQEQADKRIPVLLQIPAAVRFVSVEPMLGPVDIGWAMDAFPGDPDVDYTTGKLVYGKSMPVISWVICGGETGPAARPMHPEWARSLRDQCQDAGVPFFFKQWGEWHDFECDQRWLDIATDKAWVHLSGETLKPISGGCKHDPETVALMVRVGKKRAGRLLDGREWNEYPEV